MNKRQRIKRVKQVVHAILLGQTSDGIAMTDVLGRCGLKVVLGRCGLKVVLRRPGERRQRRVGGKRSRR